MTPVELVLGNEPLLFRSPFLVHRIVPAKFAHLSGIGAALHPGRWNSSGQEAIYTSLTPELCILERLVHTPKDRIPKNLASMVLLVRGQWKLEKGHLRNPVSGARILVLPSLARAASFLAPRYKTFALETDVFAIAVPSVITPAWNIVFYPQQQPFWEHVSLQSVEPFGYDPRLFPEDASVIDEPQ